MQTPYPTQEVQGAEPADEDYPALPAHVLERLGGYLGPGLRRRMALRRAALAEEADQQETAVPAAA